LSQKTNRRQTRETHKPDILPSLTDMVRFKITCFDCVYIYIYIYIYTCVCVCVCACVFVCVSRGLIPIRRKSRKIGTTALRLAITKVRNLNKEFTNNESTYFHMIESGFFKYTQLSRGPTPRSSLENKNFRQF